MNADEMKQLKELIEFLRENKIGEFDMERGDLKVRVKFAQEGAPASLASLAPFLAAAPATAPVPASLPAVQASTPAAPAPAAAPASVAQSEDASLHVVKSPIVGTFYESPSPGASAFVKIGDQVEQGQVLCIIEAMKLMNEIESDAAGEVVKRFVENGQPVEYGQPLFALKPR
ncbi:MAG: acetyl-CoA carboxylase biotin carboxyl carrier protein [Acidobacterium ailaaui]|jgi:acetyl-CoA carboxylase biotin carboxyl carrier protein|nr:acetyl-CoA carboxylase biotin carboxyl carrier protein [Pseudacidobacterium ailaaui]MBX6360451.1 acetyl-CoA carboxylase biotin carboxyl carrier protein [Pseudacidobacterium ailaaui]MCL6463756.1 acetyl-CoA carboxylase biotin carboxyl carrier protein [Pseudacidobacterium ailaaui]